MIHAIEVQNLGDGLFHRIGDLVECKIFGRDHASPKQHILDVVLPTPPVVPSRFVDQQDREEMALARLNERKHFESLILCAESAGEESDRIRLLNEEQLARKEVFQM